MHKQKTAPRGKHLNQEGKRLLLTLLSAAHSLNHSLFLVLPFFLYQVAIEFGTTPETIGLIAAIIGFIYGFGSLIGGPLSDRLGEVKTITLSLAFSGFSTLLFLVAHDLSSFSLAFLLIGVGASLYHPTANSIISKTFQTNMAEAMGLHGTGGNFGYMFAPLAIAAMGNLWGWRYPWILFGALSILIGVLILKTSKPLSTANTIKTRVKDVVKVSGLKTVLIYNLMVGLYFKGVDFIFPSFIAFRFDPIFVAEPEIVSALKGIAVFSLLGVGILGQWLGGKASDRFGSREALIIASVFVSLSLFLLPAVSQPYVSVALFVPLYGFFFYAHQPALNSLAGLITPQGMRGTMYGILFFFSFGLGSASTAIATSIAQRYDLNMAFYALMLFSLAALLLSLFIPSNKKDSKP